MKVSKTKLIPAGSINDSIQSPMTYASSIINMRWNADNFSWINDRGFQPYWQFPSSFTFYETTVSGDVLFGSSVASHYFWKKPTGATYLFVEQGGTIYVVFGNKGQGSSYTGSYYMNDIVVVAENRSNTPSQYIPYGDHLLIINGVDNPLWISSPFQFRDFSFTLPTARPEVIDIQSSYPQGTPLETGTGAPYFKQGSTLGLGDTTGKTNNYFWKLSYITDTGSESPLSSYENINWSVTQEAEADEYKFGAVMELPTAPKGTIARRLYRTKNCLDNEESYYFVKQFNENGSTFYVDYIPDTHLVTPAPTTIDSTIITTDYRFGESWDNRIWLAKEKKIIYSDSGLPEQFGAVSFFDLGNTIGGNITAIKAFYNNLIVFRESAINLIRFSQNGYSLATISTSIGTVSPRAITIVPNYGLTFVNEEGVWSLVGGLDGGSQISIQKISHDIDTEWYAANKQALPAVISAYSDVEKELWIHYPHGYSAVPNRGLVLHTERKTISWSFRKAIDSADDDLFEFSSLATDLGGRFVFGSVPQWASSWATITNGTTMFGPLHVWCASTYFSQGATLNSTGDDTYTYVVSETQRLSAEWESAWFEWDNGKTRIYSIELELIAKGDTQIAVDYTKDFQLDYTTTLSQKQADSEIIFTTSEPPVVVDAAAAYTSITKNPFIVNASRIYNDRRLRLRFDVNTKLCDNFKFKLRPNTNEPFELIGFKIDHTSQEIPRMNQSIRTKRGQAR